MFDANERDMLRALGQMAETAIARCNHNRIEAREVIKRYIVNDRRFDGLNPDLLADRIERCRSNGARLDLSDPRLRGQAARPLERDTSW